MTFCPLLGWISSGKKNTQCTTYLKAQNKTNEHNDCPDWLLNKIKKEIKHKKVNKSDHISKEKYNCVGLPYTEGLTNEMSRILRKFNIGVYTYPYRTIRNILPKLKDSVDAYTSISMVQFIKFLVKIVVVYILVKWAGTLTLACLRINMM